MSETQQDHFVVVPVLCRLRRKGEQPPEHGGIYDIRHDLLVIPANAEETTAFMDRGGMKHKPPMSAEIWAAASGTESDDKIPTIETRVTIEVPEVLPPTSAKEIEAEIEHIRKTHDVRYWRGEELV